jgi:Tol biopolymer transport system component
VSEIQSVEGRPLKKGLSPGRRSAVWALGILVVAIVIVVVGQFIQPPGIPADHDLGVIMADGRVGLAKADGSALVFLAGAGVPADATGILLAPGGDFVALRTSDAIVVVDRAGVVAWRKAVVGSSATFAWSPDGSRIAIFDSGGGVSSNGAPRASLQVLTAAGALEWDVPLADGFTVVPSYGNLAWSPDGGSLAFSGFTTTGLIGGLPPTTLWNAAVTDQMLSALGDGSPSDTFVYGPAWAGDGNLYVARSSAGQNGIWRIDPATGAATLILTAHLFACPTGSTCPFVGLGPLAASPDGRSLAFLDATRELTILTLATGATSTVPGLAPVAFVPYEWSSEGTALLYLGPDMPPADPAQLRRLLRFDLGTRTSALVLDGVRAFDIPPRGG